MSLNLAMDYPWLQGTFNQLQQSWQNGRFHHALLLQGAQGMGKSDFAGFVASGILCLNNTNLIPCGQCKSCLLGKAGSHPDCLTIDNGDGVIGIDEVRKAGEFVYKKSNISLKRVIVLHNIEQMSEAASNGLLKTLEEPAEHVYLVLTCNKAELLLATIVSRCNQVKINVPDRHQVFEYVHHQYPQLTEEQCDTLLRLAADAPLRVLSWLGEYSVEKIREIQHHYYQWQNGQMSSLQYSKELEQGDLAKLLFRQLLKNDLVNHIGQPSDESKDNFTLLAQTNALLNDFSDAQQKIKGQNKTLALLNLLNRLQSALRKL